MAKTLHCIAKPLRHAALSVGFAILSVWFVAASVATIHFEEEIIPLWSDAAQAVSNKSLDLTRGLARFNALLR